MMNALPINSLADQAFHDDLGLDWLRIYPGLESLKFGPQEIRTDRASAYLEDGPKGFAALTLVEGQKRLRLTSAVDPRAEDRALVEKAGLDPAIGVVCFGLGLGYYLEELAARFDGGAAVWVLESRPELAAWALRRPEVRRLFERPGFRLFIGPFEGWPWGQETPPPQQLWRPATARGLAHEYPCRPLESRHQPGRGMADPITSLKKSRSQAIKRVLFFQGGYFLDRELKNAADELGLESACWRFSRGEQGDGREFNELLELIKTFRPEMILTVNHLGFDVGGLLDDIFTRLELPVASWFVDSPPFILKDHRPGPLVRAFSWDRDYLGWLTEHGFRHAHYLPLAADSTVFRPVDNVDGCPRRVSFVGDSLTAATDKFLKKLGFLSPLDLPAGFLDQVDAASEKFLASLSFTPDQAELEKLGKKLSLALNDNALTDLAALLTWRASRLKRLKTLAAFQADVLTVAGDPCWAGLLDPPPRELLPPLNYYDGLAAFYQNSLVNLNITSAQMKSGLNQRVFDVPACGAFLLNDDQRQLADMFEIGREAVVYHNLEEAVALAGWYERHDKARREIADAGCRRVRSQHLYRHRLAEVLKLMRE